MKASAPTIMLHFSASLHADGRKRNTGMDLFGAVLNVSWYQTLGDKDMFISERWKQVAPNMWLATSQKK